MKLISKSTSYTRLREQHREMFLLKLDVNVREYSSLTSFLMLFVFLKVEILKWL